jgi:hypothetical protein
MPTPVNAPYAVTYSQHEAYVTRDEYTSDPNAVGTSMLVPGGSLAANLQALDQVLVTASSKADNICQQVLAATTETVGGWAQIAPDGYLRIGGLNTPLVQITGFTYGTTPDAQTAAATLTGIDIRQNSVGIPPGMFSPLLTAGAQVPTFGPGYYTLSYVAGYANSILRSPALVGATSLTVDNTLGIVPGMPLTIYDPVNLATETVTVLSTTATTITVALPTAFAHPAGVSVSALPPTIKQAVILLATSQIKRKGGSPQTIPNATARPVTEPQFPAGGAEYDQATKILSSFTKVI